MIDDLKKIEGKIKALAPAFELMAEMTGKPSSATMMGVYTNHFVTVGLVMDHVNHAVHAIMLGWQKGYWPSPEVIAARAQEIGRQENAKHSIQNIEGYIHEICARVDGEKWERRLGMAEQWSDANPARFEVIHKRIKTESTILSDRLAWMAENKSYRAAFKHGAIVQACNTQAGDDERRRAVLDEKGRRERAKRFAATNHIEDAA